ncbi:MULTISPECIES: GGDEF domain-containing protein [unclassified Sphingomonas]|uniref:GGDEF domain-containing protein n=1 Tax=unclassified Sphingomonas TaxID=196159 RepID=UPI0017863DF2|nr:MULTISPECIES: GGDEF domain-containing protein [unclassified Sphingomonas]MBD8471173.1 GGDEF domain-containing protein [Sphingomonas sp. CFBP 8765]MDY1006943.1 GGDEF domain-containing protein [Sphingomonas sp. CFBP9019]
MTDRATGAERKIPADMGARMARRKAARFDSFPLKARRSAETTLLESVMRKSARLSPMSALAWIAPIWAGLFVLDAVTGPLYSLNSAYLVPLCLTTWCFGRIAGLIAGTSAIVTTLHLNGFADQLSARATSITAAAAVWNASMLVLGVIFIILLVSAFRRAFDHESRNALMDPLTGLGNRRSFQREGKRQESSAARDRRILLCGVIDLDGFKAVNDQYGHAAGDEVLRIVAHALSASVRPYDITARLGGDEFAFCLTVRDEAAGERKSRSIHQALIAALETSQWRATCSLGAATGSDFEQAIRIADKIMYEAKSIKKSTVS